MPERRLDRRSFLKGSTVAAVGAAGAATIRPAFAGNAEPGECPPGRTHLVAPPDNLPKDGRDCKIDHIGVLMMENRSYDTYFGWLEGSHGFLNLGLDVEYEGEIDGEWVTRSPQHWAPLYRRCHPHAPASYSWQGGRRSIDEGFLTTGTEYPLAYYLPEDVPVYARLARQFTVLDHYHAALMAPTFPNRMYQHSGTSDGIKDNRLPNQHGQPYEPFQWPTVWDKLEEIGVSWKYYFVDLPATGLWGRRLAHRTRHIEEYFADAAAGTLPQVFFVDPGVLTALRTDDHPSQADMRSAQAYANNVVHAFVRSENWERGAFFVNYDEWGGFFDHVTPPRVPDERADAVNRDEDFGLLGFRVPCLAISPYSRKGYVHHMGGEPGPAAYEHTSILKFIAWRFGIDPWTERIAGARNIGEVFDHEQAPRLQIGIDQVETPAVFFSAGHEDCPPDPVGGVPGVPLGQAEPPSAFEALAEYVSTQGYEIGSPSWETVFGFGAGTPSVPDLGRLLT